jgi:hypothetical protein
MNGIILDIGIIVFIIYAAINIFYIIDLRRTSVAARELIKNTGENLNPALVELRGTLENIRKMTDEIGILTRDVRLVADSAASLEKGLRKFWEYYKDDIGPAVGANIAGLKAGVKTGVVTLVRNLKERKGGSS